MGEPRFELGTSVLSGLRSNQLSYTPARLNFNITDTKNPPFIAGLKVKIISIVIGSFFGC